MNSILAWMKKLFSNLICVALLVVVIVSWKAAALYQANRKRISAIEAAVEKKHRKHEQAAKKMEIQKKRKELLQDKIIQTTANAHLGNMTDSFRQLSNCTGMYVRNDIDGFRFQKDFIEAWAESYAMEKKLTAAKGKMYLNFWEEEFRNHWIRYLITAALTVFLTPFLIAVIMYYGIAFLVEKQKAEITAAPDVSYNSTELKEADARIKYALPPEHHLYLRAGWCKERKNAVTKTKMLWQWKYPLVSMAADLCELVDFSAEKDKQGEVMITAPVEDLFIGKIDLNGGELVVRPRFLIGVTDDVIIRTHWDFSVHSIFSGRVRKVILCGRGTVFLAGSWGIDQRAPQKEEDFRIESKMLLGYDSGAAYSLCRTETFWHYFRRKADLFDIKIRKGMFLTQNNAWSAMKAPKNNVDAILKFFFDGVFSLLGL